MNQDVSSVGSKKKKIFLGILVTFLCLIGVSYAWFRLYLSQSEDNSLASRTCFSTTLTEDTSKIAITDAFPISDEDGLKQTPFTFTIKNNCKDYVKIYITIDSIYRTNSDASYLKDNYMKVNVSPKGTTTNQSVILANQALTDLESNRKGYIIVNTGLGANEEKNYDLRIWMDSNTTLEQGLNKNWAGKIVVVSNASKIPAPNGWYEAKDGTLLASLRKNNILKVPFTVPGKEVSAHTIDIVPEQSFDFDGEDFISQYITYGTGWEANGTKFDLTGTSVTTGTYANSYAELIGKYTDPYVTGSNVSSNKVNTTGLEYLFYIVDATANNLTYKLLYSNKNTTEAVMASTEDNYGTSYYFRGTVDNNYVEFANKCWRVVRVDGNGNIKLILHNDNTSKVSNPCALVNNSDEAAFAHYDGTTYTSPFNSNSEDNTYVGFMYGTAGSSDYLNSGHF